jgi:glycosyltransferase involved in cell wall biosynthesis
MEKLSVVIITFNEEQNIGRCLESVQGIADEIIVSDSFSTDKTEEICKQFDAKFYQSKWLGYSGQKNAANNLASNNLIFSIDADEALSEKLKKSIAEIKLSAKVNTAFKVNRLTNYCGKWIHHCGWYPDTKLRIWFKDEAKWEGELHEKLVFNKEPQTSTLAGDLLHYSYYTLDDHYKQVEKFTNIAAQDYFDRNKKVSLVKLWLSPVVKFTRDYFLKLGFLDGRSGFRICYISAGATYLKYKKLRELIESKKIKLKDAATELEESRCKSRDVRNNK